MKDTPPPDALLFITSGCIHCPSVLRDLNDLLKQGRLGRLEVVNAQVRPDLAAESGVRSSPWIRIGEFELEGAHTRAELESWCERAGDPDGYAAYLAHLLENGQLQRVIERLERRPEPLAALTAMLGVPGTPMAVRIGVSAVLEDFAGGPAFAPAVQPLLELLCAESAQVRLDACHLLGLSGNSASRPALSVLLQDPDPEVREEARDSLDNLAALD